MFRLLVHLQWSLFVALINAFGYKFVSTYIKWILPSSASAQIKELALKHDEAKVLVMEQHALGNDLSRWIQQPLVDLLIYKAITLDSALINFNFFNDISTLSDFLNIYVKSDKSYVMLIEFLAALPTTLASHGYWDLKENNYKVLGKLEQHELDEVITAMNQFLQHALFSTLVKAYDGKYTYEQIEQW